MRVPSLGWFLFEGKYKPRDVSSRQGSAHRSLWRVFDTVFITAQLNDL